MTFFCMSHGSYFITPPMYAGCESATISPSFSLLDTPYICSAERNEWSLLLWRSIQCRRCSHLLYVCQRKQMRTEFGPSFALLVLGRWLIFTCTREWNELLLCIFLCNCVFKLGTVVSFHNTYFFTCTFVGRWNVSVVYLVWSSMCSIVPVIY